MLHVEIHVLDTEGKDNARFKKSPVEKKKIKLPPKPIKNPDNTEFIYGNCQSQMPKSTAIQINKLEAYIKRKKQEGEPYKSEFKVLIFTCRS